MGNWDKERMVHYLENSDEMVRRAVVKIWELQTADEQLSEATRHHNGVGFNGYDAQILTSFAKQIRDGFRLSEKQMSIARKRMLKYTKQLVDIANQTTTG